MKPFASFSSKIAEVGEWWDVLNTTTTGYDFLEPTISGDLEIDNYP